MSEQAPTQRPETATEWFARQSLPKKALTVVGILFGTGWAIGAIDADSIDSMARPEPAPTAATATYPYTVEFCDRFYDALDGTDTELLAAAEWGFARRDGIHPDVRVAVGEIGQMMERDEAGEYISTAQYEAAGRKLGAACGESGWTL